MTFIHTQYHYSHTINQGITQGKNSTMSVWSREEDKAFENAIATHWVEDSKEQWDEIATMVPNKTIEEIKQHYRILVEDVRAIEAGQIAIPNYVSDDKESNGASCSGASEKRSNCGFGSGFSGLGHDSGGHGGKGSSRSDQERRKGIPWTEEEHRYFTRISYYILLGCC